MTSFTSIHSSQVTPQYLALVTSAYVARERAQAFRHLVLTRVVPLCALLGTWAWHGGGIRSSTAALACGLVMLVLLAACTSEYQQGRRLKRLLAQQKVIKTP